MVLKIIDLLGFPNTDHVTISRRPGLSSQFKVWHFHPRTPSLWWTEPKFKPPRHRHTICIILEKKSACEKALLNFLLNIGSQWVKSNYISVRRDFLGKATEALRRNFLTYRFVDIWVSGKFHILSANNSRFCALRNYPGLKMEKHTMGAIGRSASETSVITCKQK